MTRERHVALHESRRELEHFDNHRETYERRDRVHHLTRIGMGVDEIATKIGIVDRTVHRDRTRPAAPQRPRLYSSVVSDERAAQLEETADLALRLAVALKEEDPTIVWGGLTRLDRRRLQELAVIALAAIPVDVPISQLLGWVAELREAGNAS